MQQAQKVQQRLEEIQEKIKDIDVQGESGGGMVKVVMSCSTVIRSVTIDPSLLNTQSKEMLEDLVAAAINNAVKTKDARVQEETRSMLEDLGLPEGAKLPF